MSEICIQCGRLEEECNDTHICDNCGANSASPLIVDDRFYCDKFCLWGKQPNNALLTNIPSSEFESFAKKASIVGKMKALRKEALESGVAWIQ